MGLFQNFQDCLLQLPERDHGDLVFLQWGPTKACDRKWWIRFPCHQRPCTASPAEVPRGNKLEVLIRSVTAAVRFPGLGQSLESSRKGWPLSYLIISEDFVVRAGKRSYQPGSLILRSCVLPMRGIKLLVIHSSDNPDRAACVSVPQRNLRQRPVHEISLRIIEIKPYLSHTQTHSLLYLTCSDCVGLPCSVRTHRTGRHWAPTSPYNQAHPNIAQGVVFSYLCREHLWK